MIKSFSWGESALGGPKSRKSASDGSKSSCDLGVPLLFVPSFSLPFLFFLLLHIVQERRRSFLFASAHWKMSFSFSFYAFAPMVLSLSDVSRKKREKNSDWLRQSNTESEDGKRKEIKRTGEKEKRLATVLCGWLLASPFFTPLG